MITKITHISLFVEDQNKAQEFFCDTLGFKVHTDTSFESMRWLTLCLLDQPDVELCLMHATTPEQKAIVGKQAPGVPLYALETTDCRAEYQRLKDLGVTFIDEPKEEPWGIGVSLKDLYGNIWYLNETKPVEPAEFPELEKISKWGA